MPPPTNDLFDTSLGFEQKLWEAADLLRSNMDPGEYKHVAGRGSSTRPWRGSPARTSWTTPAPTTTWCRRH